MAEKPQYVDLISDATRQSRRRDMPRVLDLKPEVKETSRLSHHADRVMAWRIETFTPWKIKPWNNWD